MTSVIRAGLLSAMHGTAGAAAALASGNSESALAMELAETQHGDTAISLGEHRAEQNIPKPALKLYEKALKAGGKQTTSKLH